MTPTAKLRWLELNGTEVWAHPSAIYDAATNRFRVLQQWWHDEYISIVDPEAFGDSQYGYKGEWRDLPIEEQA